jgi:hypothetical protein
MNTARCLHIAQRIQPMLHNELGVMLDPHRMLRDSLYARDVLLVCDALPGGDATSGELSALSQRFRSAAAEPAVTADDGYVQLALPAAVGNRPLGLGARQQTMRVTAEAVASRTSSGFGSGASRFLSSFFGSGQAPAAQDPEAPKKPVRNGRSGT